MRNVIPVCLSPASPFPPDAGDKFYDHLSRLMVNIFSINLDQRIQCGG